MTSDAAYWMRTTVQTRYLKAVPRYDISAMRNHLVAAFPTGSAKQILRLQYSLAEGRWLSTCGLWLIYKQKTNSALLARKRTIPTERPPLVGEVSANFCG
jgi:hypothetical protein